MTHLTGQDATPSEAEVTVRQNEEPSGLDPVDSPSSGVTATGLTATKPEVAQRTSAAAEPTSASSPSVSAQSSKSGPVKLDSVGHLGDTANRSVAYAAGFFIIALVAFVGVFLAVLAIPALGRNQSNFFTSTEWDVGGEVYHFGILGLLWTTAFSSIVAMLFAVPIAVGTALLITQYLRPAVGRTLGFILDLLAAVPSVVFGLWGLKVLGPALTDVYAWLQAKLGWIPLFGPGVQSTGNVMTASLVLAMMILPIVSAMSRDVFAQTPRDHVEAALALGATKWEMIRTAVLPYGRSGVIAASMLGLGRALGETIAVMIILSQTKDLVINPSLFAGGETFASKIANNAAEFDTPAKTGAYIAAGLVLFVVTFAVNAVARVVADRGGAK